jgi:hypothetical protein
MSTTAYDEDKAMSLAAIADNLEALVEQLTRIADALEGWHADAEEEQAELTPGEAGIMAARSEY